MPKRITPLTDATVRAVRPAEKPKKLFDGGGLFLLVTPTGGKLWRLKYRFGGAEKLLPLVRTSKYLLQTPDRSVSRRISTYEKAQRSQ